MRFENKPAGFVLETGDVLRLARYIAPHDDALRARLTAAEARCRALEEALNAACVITHGRAYFRTKNGIPMEINPKRERIIRAALAPEVPHDGPKVGP